MCRRAPKKQMKTGAWMSSETMLFMGLQSCFCHRPWMRSWYSFCAACPLPRCRDGGGQGRGVRIENLQSLG